MPLEDFIAETTSLLKSSPDAAEICVERVKPLRTVESGGSYDNFLNKFNEMGAATSH